MNAAVCCKTYAAPPVDRDEILRYARAGRADERVRLLLEDCLEETCGRLSYRVCWREFPVAVRPDGCQLGTLSCPSADLARALDGCGRAVLFAATVGVELDRLIVRYGRLSPARALLLDALGSERIEALCDAFCAELAAAAGQPVRPRFSPGYGDLPLAFQRDVFAALECGKRIGLGLN
ncbi:MAG: Vitamin B12 dependent methionine synthase activation subunit, partial [Oscillospiraceae bacterium]|nr:Vitamin B12 dependent methionine synthase activation subunit [Oscillospiraceae bacterium]